MERDLFKTYKSIQVDDILKSAVLFYLTSAYKMEEPGSPDASDPEKLIAETEKLCSEAASLRKGGWSKSSSWIPILAAFAAIGTSVGQFQVNTINQREAALEAREKVVEAKEEEKQLRGCLKRHKLIGNHPTVIL